MIRSPTAGLIACLILMFTAWPAQGAEAESAPAPDPYSLRYELDLAERWLTAQRAYDRVPGLSAAIVHDQTLLWSGATGYADLAAQRPARTDTIYGICSISKLFTGIAVMQLRDRGGVALDQSLAALLPWFQLAGGPDGPEVTLRNVLSHASGLPRESDMPYWVGPDFDFPSREQLRELLAGQEALYPADRYFQYSNLGLTLAGEVVAEMSGLAYEDYVRANILAPLALNDTDTGFPTDARAERIATGYGYPGRDAGYPVMPRYDARAITPAAGFTSTVLDLARFASWQFRLLGGAADEVLHPDTLREMQRVQWMDWDWSVARGLAFGVYRVGERTLSGHAGDCPGFNTRLFLDPVSRYAVITMANRNATDVDGYAVRLLDILEAGGTPADDNSDAPAADFTAYVGSYDARPWSGEDLVFGWEDGLAMVNLPSMDPLGEMVKLKHAGGDRFRTVRSDGEPGHGVTFRRDAEGQVSHLEYHGVSWPRLEP